MQPIGLIETIKVVNGKLVLKEGHVQRLCNSLKLLNVPTNPYQIEDRIARLLKYECIEKQLKNFRLRMEIQKNRAHNYMPDIATLKWNCTLKPLEETTFVWKEDGLKLTLLPKQFKMIDAFANLKHTDRTIYDAAAAYARSNRFDDAIVLNENKVVADTSIYNIFMVKDDKIFTPPLQDAPVSGVCRAYILSKFPEYAIEEKSITVSELYQADELFVTNAVRGIQWVSSLDEKIFNHRVTKKLFESFSQSFSK